MTAIIGYFGVGKMNENGQRLLKLCTYYDLVVTNEYFKTKPKHKVSWRHPRSKKWHHLDLILTRRSTLKDITHTRSHHSANCDTDTPLYVASSSYKLSIFTEPSSLVDYGLTRFVLNSPKKFNVLQTQEIFAECTTGSKKLRYQSRKRPLL